MNTQRLIEGIEERIAELRQAADIIAGKAAAETPRKIVRSPNGRTSRYTMSAAARKRIAEAQKARWAKAKTAYAKGVKSGEIKEGTPITAAVYSKQKKRPAA